jgi:hypothetical protein
MADRGHRFECADDIAQPGGRAHKGRPYRSPTVGATLVVALETAGFAAMSDGPFDSTISILIFATGKFTIGSEVIERRYLTASHT